MSDLHELTALELAGAIARREVSAVETARHFLDRAETCDDVGAFTTITRARALELAEQADVAQHLAQHRAQRRAQRRAQGSGGATSPLHGVPIGIKDLVPTAGLRTTLGSAAFADTVPVADDELVTALRSAHLVDIGKTTVPEFGLTCYTEPEVAPPARSPWDRTRTAAGSSGGAAAAVAARLLPVAQGSDTGGSLRSPAAACGVLGLKTSRGRVTLGAGHDAFGLSVRGPLARDTADLAALLDVMAAGPGSGTVWPATTSFLDAVRQPAPTGLRVLLLTGCVSGRPIASTCADAAARVAGLLEAAGHLVETAEQTVDDRLVEGFRTIWGVLATSMPVPADRVDLLRPITRHLRDAGARLAPRDVLAAYADLQGAARDWLVRHHEADVVVTPTVATLPPHVGAIRDDLDPERELENMLAFTGPTPLANATGRPALNVPVCWTDDGLPVGVTLGAAWGREDLLLQVAAQLQEIAPWGGRTPPTPNAG